VNNHERLYTGEITCWILSNNWSNRHIVLCLFLVGRSLVGVNYMRHTSCYLSTKQTTTTQLCSRREKSSSTSCSSDWLTDVFYVLLLPMTDRPTLDGLFDSANREPTDSGRTTSWTLNWPGKTRAAAAYAGRWIQRTLQTRPLHGALRREEL